MNVSRQTVRITATALILCACVGCSTITQEIINTAVAQHATLLIDGDAPFVDLEYILVDHEVREAPDISYHVSHLGDHATRERLPMMKSFLVNS